MVVEGLPKANTALKAIGQKAPKALGAALFREGERIIGDSKEHYCPVVIGNLRSTGHVQKPLMTAKGVMVEGGYGGPAAPYAEAVHENPNTGKTATGSQVGQWKYLEVPFNNAKKGQDERIAKDIRSQMPEAR